VKVKVSVSLNYHVSVCLCVDLGTKRIHFVGLVSDGGVHSHLRHLKSLLQITKRRSPDFKAFVHAITDGRDTAPCSADKFVLEDLLPFLEEERFACLGSVCGRYYAMDRDKRWERTEEAFKMLTGGEGEQVSQESLLKVSCL
jgi:2,3-bisphosphoglycerate-independent phosphoglycerate mutase